MYKVYTAQLFGNSVRFLGIFFMILFINSCSLFDTPTTTDVIDNIIGTWKCAENSDNYGDQNYEVIISKSGENTISIKNFFENGITVNAEIQGFLVTIPSQTKSGFTIEGSGTIYSGYSKITLSYSVTDASETTNCTATYTPK